MKVIIGTDDSSFSRGAIDQVLGMTWAKDTQFLVVSAVAPIFMGSGEAAAPDAISKLMAEQESYHREIADRDAARLREGGLRAEARAMIGDPRSAIVEIANAQKADLIVVGSHGRTGLKRLLLGSVASHIVAHAHCSVLVVRERS